MIVEHEIRTSKSGKVFWKTSKLAPVLKNGSGRDSAWNRDNVVGADVPSAASAPTLIETPRSIPTEPPMEDSKFFKSTSGLPTVPSTGVPSILASKVKSSPADASTLAKTVAFAAPFRSVTPISRRGIMWASARPVKVAEAPTLSLIAIRNMSAGEVVGLYRTERTGILRVDVGGAIAFGGGEGKLHVGQGDRGTDRDVGYNTEFGVCLCVDAEGRPDSEYPGKIESRKADFEELNIWSLEGALGVGINVEGSGNVSGKAASESLFTLWSGRVGISCRGTAYQFVDIRGDD